MDINKFDAIMERVDRVIDLADKWINIYAFTKHPDQIAQAGMNATNPDASGYDEGANKQFGLRDRKVVVKDA
jgi:hypothetical protein